MGRRTLWPWPAPGEAASRRPVQPPPLLCLALLAVLAAAGFGCPPAAQAAPAPVVSAAAADPANSDYDYASGGRFEEYPVVVPKRGAMLLDRIMTELQSAMGEGDASPGGGGLFAGGKTTGAKKQDGMDMQRRGQQKGNRAYWRCYFNAVTCFKRK